MTQESVQSDSGGRGGLLDDRTKIGADVAMLHKAVRENWNIPAETLQNLPAKLQAIIDDPKTTKRTRIMAARTLATFKQQNQADRHHVERMQHEDGMLDLRYRKAAEGQPEAVVEHRIAPARELPLPAALREYRRRILEPKEN